MFQINTICFNIQVIISFQQHFYFNMHPQLVVLEIGSHIEDKCVMMNQNWVIKVHAFYKDFSCAKIPGESLKRNENEGNELFPGLKFPSAICSSSHRVYLCQNIKIQLEVKICVFFTLLLILIFGTPCTVCPNNALHFLHTAV